MGILDRFRAKKTTERRRPAINLALTDSIYGNVADMSLKGSEAICAAVTRIANTVASMPLHLYKDYDEAVGDPLNDLVNYAPNANMTPHNFKFAMMACLGVYGYAYALKVPNGLGGVESLDVIDPMRVQICRNRETKEIWYQITLDQGEQAYVHSTDMIALKWATTDGIHSVSPVEVLGATLKYDKAIKEVSMKQLEGVSGAIALSYPTALDERRKQAIEERFVTTYKKSSGQVLVLEGGVTAEKIAGSVVDPKVLETDNISKSKVASVYGMPLRMVGSSTSDYSSYEQAMKEFVNLTIMPWIDSWEQELNRKLLTKDKYDAGYRFRFSDEALLRGDTAAMANKHSTLIRAGVMTPNDARAELGMRPIDCGNELMSARDLIPLRISVETPELLLGNGTTKQEEGDTDE